MILGQMGTEVEAYFIDMAFGLLVIAKGSDHFGYYPDVKQFRKFEATAHEKTCWARITEKEAR